MFDHLLSAWLRLQLWRNDRGASLVEYALLVGLIALVCVAGVAALGGKTSRSYSSMAGLL